MEIVGLSEPSSARIYLPRQWVPPSEWWVCADEVYNIIFMVIDSLPLSFSQTHTHMYAHSHVDALSIKSINCTRCFIVQDNYCSRQKCVLCLSTHAHKITLLGAWHAYSSCVRIYMCMECRMWRRWPINLLCICNVSHGGKTSCSARAFHVRIPSKTESTAPRYYADQRRSPNDSRWVLLPSSRSSWEAWPL